MARTNKNGSVHHSQEEQWGEELPHEHTPEGWTQATGRCCLWLLMSV
jgi:hypothetical protein